MKESVVAQAKGYEGKAMPQRSDVIFLINVI
jgi:hypothetical protein